MKIFISWSGKRSLAVAQVLKIFIKVVLQGTEPWISSEGIERGTAWREKLRQELERTDTGIICITKANSEASWLLFEAGAIAKMENSRTCTILIDLTAADIKGPLAQFQHTNLTQESLRRLLKELNTRLPEKGRLDEDTFAVAFDAHWPLFEKQLKEAAATPEENAAPPPRSDADMLKEILDVVRETSRTVTGMVTQSEAEKAQATMSKWLGQHFAVLSPEAQDPAAGISGVGKTKLYWIDYLKAPEPPKPDSDKTNPSSS